MCRQSKTNLPEFILYTKSYIYIFIGHFEECNNLQTVNLGSCPHGDALNLIKICFSICRVGEFQNGMKKCVPQCIASEFRDTLSQWCFCMIFLAGIFFVYCTDVSDGSAEISRDFTESEKVNSRLISITRRCRQQNGWQTVRPHTTKGKLYSIKHVNIDAMVSFIFKSLNDFLSLSIKFLTVLH